jgi:hypothetical protein
MSSIYEMIGRLVVALVWRRYGRQIQTAAVVGAGAAVLAIGAYVASRESGDEG